METLLAVSIFFVLYPYLIYPGLIIAISRFKKRVLPKGTRGRVAIVCSLHNEESVVAEKIRNFYEIDYPDMELYLGLDGCSDNTKTIAENAAKDDRVTIVPLSRMGKVGVLNHLLALVKQPYVVMTDANTIFNRDAVRLLMRCMAEGVGVVCGRLVLRDAGGTSGEGFYWKLETRLKQAESGFGCVMGANGGIYLIRKKLCDPLPPDTINDDFSLSMRALERGLKVVYAEEAVAVEDVASSDRVEFFRHVRDSAGHYRALRHHWRMLNPFHGLRFFCYTGHRAIRWMSPFMILVALIASGILAYRGHPSLLYLLGTCAALMVPVHFFGVRWKLVYIPYYFCLLNVAMAAGFSKNLLGLQGTTWQSTQR